MDKCILVRVFRYFTIKSKKSLQKRQKIDGIYGFDIAVEHIKQNTSDRKEKIQHIANASDNFIDLDGKSSDKNSKSPDKKKKLVWIYKLSKSSTPDFLQGKYNIGDEIELVDYNDGVGPKTSQEAEVNAVLTENFLIYKDVKILDDIDPCYLPFLSDSPNVNLQSEISVIKKEGNRGFILSPEGKPIESSEIDLTGHITAEIVCKSRAITYKHGKRPYYRIYICREIDLQKTSYFILSVWNSQVFTLSMPIKSRISIRITQKNRYYGKAFQFNSYSDSYFIDQEMTKHGQIYIIEENLQTEEDSNLISNNQEFSKDDSQIADDLPILKKNLLPFNNRITGLISSISTPFKRRRNAKVCFLDEENITDDIQDFYFITVCRINEFRNSLSKEEKLMNSSKINEKSPDDEKKSFENILLFNDGSTDFHNLKGGDFVQITNLYKHDKIYTNSIFTELNILKNIELEEKFIENNHFKTGVLDLFDVSKMKEVFQMKNFKIPSDSNKVQESVPESFNYTEIIHQVKVENFDDFLYLSEKLVINEGIFVEISGKITYTDEGIAIEYETTDFIRNESKKNLINDKIRISDYNRIISNKHQKSYLLLVENEQKQEIRLFSFCLPDKKSNWFKIFMVRVDYDTVLCFVVKTSEK